MPDRSRWSVEVPKVSIPSFIFGSPSGPLPDGLAYADADAPSTLSFTWSTFREWSKRFAAGLLAAGLQQGDRVLIFSANDVFYPVIYMGIIMAGGIYTSANARYVPRELAYHLQSCEAKFMLSSDANLPVALEAAEHAGITRDQIFLFNDDPLLRDGSGNDNKKEGIRHWKYLIASPERGAKFTWEDLTPEQSMTRTAALNYSSGTTGLPKGVESSHYNFIANAIQTDYVMSLDPKLSTYENAARNSRWICVIPLYHGLAQCYFFTIAARRRVATYIMKSYELNRMLEHVQNFKISELHLVPPIVVAMTKHQGIKSGKCDLSSVTKTFSCAAPLGAEVCVQYEALWPEGVMNVKQGFAMSE
jgi:4-coumarate--CoA ligase